MSPEIWGKSLHVSKFQLNKKILRRHAKKAREKRMKKVEFVSVEEEYYLPSLCGAVFQQRAWRDVGANKSVNVPENRFYTFHIGTLYPSDN